MEQLNLLPIGITTVIVGFLAYRLITLAAKGIPDSEKGLLGLIRKLAKVVIMYIPNRE